MKRNLMKIFFLKETQTTERREKSKKNKILILKASLINYFYFWVKKIHLVFNDERNEASFFSHVSVLYALALSLFFIIKV